MDLRLGDCIELMNELEDESIKAIVTDPPYGINYKSGRQSLDRKHALSTGQEVSVREEYFSTIQGDEQLPTRWLATAYHKLMDGGALYAFCHWRTWHELFPAVTKYGFTVKGMIVLHKSNHGMGDLKGTFAPKHELLLFAVKGRHLLNFPNGRIPDVWNVPVVFSGRKRIHPNEKPVDWYLRPILQSTNEGDTVLDPFMGSGTGGEACIQTGRRFIGFDIDPECIETAKKRLCPNQR